MAEWVYLIRNGELYKIGKTSHFQQRMKQLRPNEVVAKIKTGQSRTLEKRLHNRFRNKRIPQTEYFRLNKSEIKYCKNVLNKNSFLIVIKILFYFIGYLLGGLLIFSCIEPLIRLLFDSSTTGIFFINQSFRIIINILSGFWLIFSCLFIQNNIRSN